MRISIQLFFSIFDGTTGPVVKVPPYSKLLKEHVGVQHSFLLDQVYVWLWNSLLSQKYSITLEFFFRLFINIFHRLLFMFLVMNTGSHSLMALLLIWCEDCKCLPFLLSVITFVFLAPCYIHTLYDQTIKSMYWHV